MRPGFNALLARKGIVEWIRNFVNRINPKMSVVIGISGGKDSTVVAALLSEALGPDRVVGVMMPNGVQPDINDSHRVIDALGIRSEEVNIHEAFVGMCKALGENLRADVTINLPPRLRMAALYGVAQNQPNGALVVNTCNLSEDFVGYSTKFGDSAGDFSPISRYLVSEVIAIGDTYDEIPRDLIHKVPSDGLCGKTDEDRFGFKYDDIETLLTTGDHPNEEIKQKIIRMNMAGRHKLEPMPYAPYFS